MPLDFSIEPPRWLQDEIKWRRSFGDDATKLVTTGLAMGNVLLQQKGQREAMAMQADEQKRMHEDMEQLPVWLQQHDGDPNGYVPKSRWGQVTSAQAWQRKYQEGLMDARKTQAEAMLKWRQSQADNQSVEGKERVKVIDQFNKDLMAVPTDSETSSEKSAILALPKESGLPSAEAFRRLGELQKKYPKIPKAQSPVGKLEADRQEAIRAGAPPEVIKAYDQAIAKQAPKEAGEPMTKKIGDVTIAWMPGANTLHIIKNGKGTELTPSQASKISEQPGMSATDRDFFRQYATAKAKEQTRGFEAAPAPAKPEEPKKAGLFERIGEWFRGTKTEAKPSESPTASVPGTSSHDEEADLAARPAGKTIPKAKTQADIDDLIKQANEAISKGKKRDAVIQRLREMGVSLKEANAAVPADENQD